MSSRTGASAGSDFYHFIFSFMVAGILLFFTFNVSAVEFTKADVMLPSSVSSDSGNKVIVADFDDDGNDEIFIANDGQNRLLKYNSDNSKFEDLTLTDLPIDSGDSKGVAVGDIDGTNGVDIVIANYNGQNKVLLNKGDGTFEDATDTWLPDDTLPSVTAALGDIDNDNDLDLVIGNSTNVSANAIKVFINNGSSFTDETSTWITSAAAKYVQKVILTDLNADDNDDLLVFASLETTNFVYISSGSAFADETSTRFPTIVLVTNKANSAAIGDVNGDTYPDIYIANDSGERNRIYINDGIGNFADETTSRLPADTDSSLDCVLADVDGDSDLDITIANGVSSTEIWSNGELITPCIGAENKVYINDGSGNFSVAGTLIFDDSEELVSSGVIVGQFGAEGDTYILFTNSCGGESLSPAPTLWSSGEVQGAPEIADAIPNPVKPLKKLTISGTSFGSSEGTVTFTDNSENKISSSIELWSDTVITVTVPFGAGPVSSTVTVTTSESVSDSASVGIKAIKPKIRKYPKTVKRNKTYKITGNNFGVAKSDVKVTVGGKQASVKTVKQKYIKVKISKKTKKAKKSKLKITTVYGSASKKVRVK